MRLGSPDDIGECVLPLVLKRFAETHPGVTVDVVIDQSSNLRKRLDERRLDVTLVNISQAVPTRDDVEIMLDEELVWAGAKCGTAYRRDPLPLSIWEEGVHGALMRYRRWKERAALPRRLYEFAFNRTARRYPGRSCHCPFQQDAFGGGYRRSGA